MAEKEQQTTIENISYIENQITIEGRSYNVKFVFEDSDTFTVSDKLKYLIDGKKQVNKKFSGLSNRIVI
jgi:hypothetical protein